MQTTLKNAIAQSGIGLHSGHQTQVRILPAPHGSGCYFIRTDLANSPQIPAHVSSVSQTVLSTQLGNGEASVRTVEHLLAALQGMGVTNAQIEIDGPEVPLLDGSARIWAESIASVGVVTQTTEEINTPTINEPIWLRENDIFVAAIPSPTLRFTYGIDFDLPAIGNQWHSWQPSSIPDEFITEIAPARTFGLLHQIEYLQKTGLIKGGSLENALVCGPEGWLNPPLRYPNEPVRHKILDLVGDLSLLGTIPTAHYLAYKASHNLHVQLARQILG